jgi:hypothetical protein
MIAVNRNTHKGSGGNEKLLPRRISTVAIIQKVPPTQTQLSHNHITTMVVPFAPPMAY